MLYIFAIIFVFASTNPMLAETPDIGSEPFSQKCVCANDAEFEDALASMFTKEMGYTLIGAKPVSEEECFFGLFDRPEMEERIRDFLVKAFSRSAKFILKIPSNPHRCFPVELIHKKALAKVIRENPELQAFIERKFVDIEAFFFQLQNERESIFKALDHDDFLLGLVLGYGRTNSTYYCRRNALRDYLGKNDNLGLLSEILHPNMYRDKLLSFYFLDIAYDDPQKPDPNPDFESLESEWLWIKEVEWNLARESRRQPPYYSYLPFYICRHGGDSEQVRARYETASGRIVDLFRNRSFSEVVLEQAR